MFYVGVVLGTMVYSNGPRRSFVILKRFGDEHVLEDQGILSWATLEYALIALSQ